ncbi:MAG: MFS transporter [Nevskiaceae bacterium]
MNQPMRQVWTLTLAQGLAACGTIILVSFAGIIGTHIAPSAALATLPLSLSVLGVASMSLPAALLMQRIGRKPAFVASALIASLATLGCARAIHTSNFALLCGMGFFIGGNMAFVQQYRFAAMELVPASDAGRAASTVMIGTLGAALLGPTVGEFAKNLGGWTEYTGSFVVLSGLCILAALVLSRIPLAHPTGQAEAPSTKRFGDFLRVPGYRLAVFAGLSSYAVMSFIMTATPLSMHVHDGFSGSETTVVITAHLLGMYLPSLATPWLVAKLGPRGMIATGLLANVLCIGIAAWVGHEFLHYFTALLILGVGWNLMFVGATVLLAAHYAPADRFRAQGYNDLSVFGSQAVASLLAGTAIETLGWQTLNLVALPLLALVAWSLWRTPVDGAPRPNA